MRTAKKTAITPEQKTALLKQLKAGNPRIIAADRAGVPLALLLAAGAELEAELAAAEEYAEAHLTALLLQKGLAGDQASLRMAVERRDRASGRADGQDLFSMLCNMSDSDLERLGERLPAAVSRCLGLTVVIQRFGHDDNNAPPGARLVGQEGGKLRYRTASGEIIEREAPRCDTPGSAYHPAPALEADEPGEPGGHDDFDEQEGGSA